MIISRTPFRISFCGGGSDLPSFYEKYSGCVLSTSINKYMYISVHPYFDAQKISLKYSKNELTDSIQNIDHPIFKAVFSQLNIRGVEITSTADIPAGTGLGSSSTFTVGLLHTLHAYKGSYVSKSRLAEEACNIEINVINSPIGKQDQYAAAFGGLNFFQFNIDGSVSVHPIMIKKETSLELQKNLMLFYTGTVRSANSILKEQNQNMQDSIKVNNVQQICALAKDMKNALENSDLQRFASILHESWQLKKSLASGITNTTIDEVYEVARKNGAIGGKLLGAGGGGFLLFYCEQENQVKLRHAIGLKQIPINFDFDGSSIIYVGDKYWEGSL